MKALKKYEPPKSKQDVICMLSDTEGDTHRVFMDIRPEDVGKTISTSQCFIDKVIYILKIIILGIFDLSNKTWSMYIKNPKVSKPVWEMRLEIKETV